MQIPEEEGLISPGAPTQPLGSSLLEEDLFLGLGDPPTCSKERAGISHPGSTLVHSSSQYLPTWGAFGVQQSLSLLLPSPYHVFSPDLLSSSLPIKMGKIIQPFFFFFGLTMMAPFLHSLCFYEYIPFCSSIPWF